MSTRNRKNKKKLKKDRILKKIQRKYNMDSPSQTPCENFLNNTGSSCPNCCSSHTNRCIWKGRNYNPKCITKPKWVLDSLKRELGQNSTDINRRFIDHYNRVPDGLFQRYPEMSREEYNRILTNMNIGIPNFPDTTNEEGIRTFISDSYFTVFESDMIDQDEILRRVIRYARRNNFDERRAQEIFRQITDEIFDPQPPDTSSYTPSFDQDSTEREDAIRYMQQELNIIADNSPETEFIIEQIIEQNSNLRSTEPLESRFDNLSIGDNEPIDDCSICLMPLDSEVYTLPGKRSPSNTLICNHKFHKKCLKQCWKSLSSLHQRQSSQFKCPVCRTPHARSERNRVFSSDDEEDDSIARGVSAQPVNRGSRARGTRGGRGGRGGRGRGRGTRGRGRGRGARGRGTRGRGNLPPGF